MEEPKIIGCLIVKNESACLAKCLDSIKGVDNLYIVDTGSEDDTVEIAKRYTENVYTDFTWCDDFAKARNHVLNKVKEENAYILSIDADEYLHDFNALKEAVIEANKQGALAVDCKLYAENNGQMHYFPRLFKKSPQVWWEGAVHNHISVLPKRIGNVEITYGYSPAHLKDPDRAMRILKKESEKPDCSPRIIFYLGREYWYRRIYQDCVTTMNRYIEKSQFLAEKADALLITSRCYWAMGMGDKARESCMQAIIINPNFKEAVEFMVTLSGKGTGNELWEHNALQWERMAQTADNSNVLFIR